MKTLSHLIEEATENIIGLIPGGLNKQEYLHLKEKYKGILETIVKESFKNTRVEEFKRQWIGDKWGTDTGEHETLYGQTQSEVDYYNSALENVGDKQNQFLNN